MTTGRHYADKRDYVCGPLRITLEALKTFKSIEYQRSYVDEREIVKITDSCGVPAYLNVTAYDNEQILADVAKLVFQHKVPSSYVIEKDDQRAAAALFG